LWSLPALRALVASSSAGRTLVPLRTPAADTATARADHHGTGNATGDFLANYFGDVTEACCVVWIFTWSEAANPAALHIPIEVAHLSLGYGGSLVLF